MAYDAKKIYYRFDDHLSRLVLDYCRPPRTTRACS